MGSTVNISIINMESVVTHNYMFSFNTRCLYNLIMISTDILLISNMTIQNIMNIELHELTIVYLNLLFVTINLM